MIHSSLTLETMKFLRNLTNDGELTGEEVWSLAQWLNQHRSVWDAWPAKLLIEPLEHAFTDGHLSLEEMHSLALLIGKIEHEWAGQFKRDNPLKNVRALPSRSVSPGPKGVLPDPAFLLPSLDLNVRATPDPGGEEFTIGLKDHVCQCADWVVKRQSLPPQTLGRCCNHIAQALAENLAADQCEPWMRAVLADCAEHGRGIHPEYQWRLLSGAGGTIAIAEGTGDWVNVFSPAENGYERFGYNRKEQRWSYGESPAQAQEIVKTIQIGR